VKLLTAAEMASMDRQATEQYAIPSLVLMENAGRAVADAALDADGGLRGREVAVFCGKGNNGGDGLVAARHLLRAGADPLVFVVGSFQNLKGDARKNLDMATRAGVRVRSLADTADLKTVAEEVRRAAIVIDALFGTGFKPPARGFYEEVIVFINDLGLPIVAVDIPSGLSADHGRVAGASVAAGHTVTFGLPKVGQFLYPAAAACGRITLADIGFPSALEERISASHRLVTPRSASALLSPRPPDCHKGQSGHLLILAGSRGMVGAAVLAARGALRAGAGLVTVALPESQAPPCLDGLPEAMVLPLPETSRGTPAEGALDVLLEQMPGKQAMAIGPGLSRNKSTARLVRTLITHVKVPLVVDADGLNAIADSPSILLESVSDIVATPHPGELGRLLGLSAAQIQEQRIEVARNFSKKYGLLVVLKGARTVVAAPSGQVSVNTTGNAGMAAGGMGDVLTGAIGALIAQGHTPRQAAVLGSYLHGRAGDIAAAETGPWGYLAAEVADLIPAALSSLLTAAADDKRSTGNLRLLIP
jgi:NAD(P)H-hydrate epimerase